MSVLVVLGGPFILEISQTSADSGGALGSTAESAAAVIGAGKGFHCWIDSGAAKCIGLNAEGQLGDGTLTPRTAAVVVSGLNSGVIAIAAGDAHGCALTSVGAVWCWGSNDRGQLGNGTTTDSSMPVPVLGLSSGVVRIDAGMENSCAVTSQGRALCWGNNQTFGTGSITTDANSDGEFDPVLIPAQVTGLNSGVVAISISGERSNATTSVVHGCAVLQYGDVMCWGSNSSGQLGTTLAGATATPNLVVLSERVNAVTVGALHTCALTESRVVKCWGANSFGQLGNGGVTAVTAGTTIDVSTLGASNVQISAGRYTTCAVNSSGGLMCWGDNIYGLIVAGSGRSNVTTPVVPYSLTSGIEAVSLSEYSTCALFVSGDLRCWGANASGQTGDGYQVRTISPTEVHTSVGNSAPLTGVQSLGSSGWGNCALMLAGGLNCWGYNVNGELGDGRNIGSPQPVAHATLSSGIQRIEGQSNTKCALMTSGEVRCWGQNNTGQQATGDTVSTLSTRTMLLAASTPVTGVTDIAVGQRHSCVVAGGGAFCAGNNLNGALGNGTTTASSFLVPVSGLSSGVAKIAVVGISSTCAVLTDGTGRCWGNDGQGQLGNGMGSSSTTPVVVTGLTNAVDVVAGENFACARKQNQTVECWGHNSFGQLGNGNTALQQSPVAVSGLTDATEIVAGPRSVCALVANGAMRCWGWNFHGIFADGTTNNSSQPVAAQGLSGVTSVSKGLTSICVVIAGGAVKCWGSEQSGQLGNNRMENRNYNPDVVLATGLIRSLSLSPLTLLAATTTTAATTASLPTTTLPVVADSSSDSSSPTSPDQSRVDDKVYVVAPASVGRHVMLRIVRSANVRTITVSSVTPKTCVAGGRSVVALQAGDCRVLIRSLRTGNVLRQWRTTISKEDPGIGSIVRVAPVVQFSRASLGTSAGTVKTAFDAVRGARSAFVVGHSAFLTGNTPENRRLSNQRASQVAQRLRSQLKVRSVDFVGVGGDAPIASQLKESSQSKNRRAVIYYVP